MVLALVLVLCLGACGKNESTVENTVEPDTAIEETIETEAEPEVETEEPKEEIPVIYEENERINLYLNRYNEVNTEAPIESGDLNRQVASKATFLKLTLYFFLRSFILYTYRKPLAINIINIQKIISTPSILSSFYFQCS